ncbi:MAG: FAD-binding protein [Pseudomonadota bacterium]
MRFIPEGWKVTKPANDTVTETKVRIESWMKVFFGDIFANRFENESELTHFVKGNEYSCIGQSHSYNGVQVVPETEAIVFGASGLNTCTVDTATLTATCGPSTTIKELKDELLKHNRGMLNSGNYMAQTVIGALVTGTHGYGSRAPIADGVVELTFLDGDGQPHTIGRGDPDFQYALVSFGTVAPIISVTIESTELMSYQSDAWITRLSKKANLKKGAVAVSWAVVPYSKPNDPLIMLHTLRPATEGKAAQEKKPPLFSLGWLAQLVIEQFWVFDRTFPTMRRTLQRFADRLNIRTHRRVITKPEDIDFLYDPEPLLKSQRSPDVLQGFFSTTHTAYNLAFFVPLSRADDLVRFVMLEAESLRHLGFHLKSLIGVRELNDKSDLPFAGNFNGPVAAIDLFADVRDYAWLERLQREVIAYFDDVRPHWGKSAIVPDFAASLGENHINALRELHQRHYPQGNLKTNERVRKLFDLGRPAASTVYEMAKASGHDE